MVCSQEVSDTRRNRHQKGSWKINAKPPGLDVGYWCRHNPDILLNAIGRENAMCRVGIVVEDCFLASYDNVATLQSVLYCLDFKKGFGCEDGAEENSEEDEEDARSSVLTS